MAGRIYPYCPNCGTENADLANFCQRCGRDLRVGRSGPVFPLKQIVAALGSALVIWGVFLPIAHLTLADPIVNQTYSPTYWDANQEHGRVVFGLAVCCAALAALSLLRRLRWIIYGIWIPGLLCLGLTLTDLMDSQNRTQAIPEWHLAYGWIPALVGGAILLLAPLLPNRHLRL